jgi:nucleotide sugar dehydrogenase
VRVAVIGAGYVGSVTAAGLARFGHTVSIFDRNPEAVPRLLRGRPLFFEPGLEELIATGLEKLVAADSIGQAVEDAAVVMICVNTPDSGTGSIDLSFVRTAVSDVASATSSGPLAIAIRSTVVPGTTAQLDTTILAPARARGRQLAAVANPEFLREGRAVTDFLHPDRIVVGADDNWAGDLVSRLYAGSPTTIMRMTRSSAELAKYMNNALLATLVSFSNEMADIAEAIDEADVTDALLAVHADRRWHDREGQWDPAILSYLWPGCGYGGSCLPKDVKALRAQASALRIAVPMLEAIDSINESRVAKLAEDALSALPNPNSAIAVLGTAFKAGTRDERFSPGLRVASELKRRAATVLTYDPLIAMSSGTGETLTDVLSKTKVWIVATLAAEFEGLPERALEYGAVLIDARRRFAPTFRGYRGPGLSRSSTDS